MRKWNEDFYHDWKNMDDLSFHTAINRLPEDVRKYGDCRFMSDAMYKIWKSEDVISPKSIGSDELAQATPNEIDNTIKISDIVNILLKFIISSSLMIVYEILLINV